ncbi:MAG: polysaccharide deacetylase family protein [Lachnospiraceae bacterium]|nr:polysaccharide deacetylase family protein [Lachnospiraceae bacterium]
MADYMKGYTSRNRKRRSAFHRKSERVAQRASRRNRVLSTARMHHLGRTYHLGIRVALVALVVFTVIYFWLPKNTGEPITMVTGSSVTETVAAVDSPAPEVTATPAPTPRSKAVAFTFDDGPNKEVTPKILAVLKKYNAHATFFVVGNRVPGGVDALKQAVAQGCEIGNHSWDHANLSKQKMKQVRKEYRKTVDIVKKNTGFSVGLLRPPYGAISQVMRKKLKHPMVLWNVDTEDWKSRNAKKVFKEIRRTVSDGNIILMHDLYPSTAEAIEKAIPWLIKKDYDILTVSELMERKGIKMKNGIAYGAAK